MNRPSTLPRWRKSSYSNGTGGECVEVADLGSAVGVRDSKRLGRAHIAVRPAAWAQFVASLRRA
ncbi:DUF397 domain-containing protein [Streptomyces brevispora]|uniref:DUF397 domain-containing protein n=1 Tax=Streptomyces brevispora TaxID=887462 RepID=UPI002E3621CB|nr:DUF397 domain-containing protein [Streptomyces brevispora]